MLLRDVCFSLEILSVQSWTAHRPVIRKFSDNSEGAVDCHSIFLSFQGFFWSVSLMERVGTCTSVWSAICGFPLYNFAMAICCTLKMKML